MRQSKLLVIVLLFSSVLRSTAQLPDSLLRKQCLKWFRDYAQNSGSSIGKETEKGLYLEIHVDEVLSGIFTGIKVFRVSPAVCDDCPIFQYVVNTVTGQLVTLINRDSFNKTMDACPSSFTNLDRGYFYLILNGIAKNNLNGPNDYNTSVNKNSVFLSSNNYGLLNLFEDDQLKIFNSYTHASTPTNIWIATQRFEKDRLRSTIYNFSFDNVHHIMDISKIEL